MNDTHQSDKNQKMVLTSIAKWLVIFALIAFVCYKNQDLMQEALEEISGQYLVGNVSREGSTLFVRVISENKPEKWAPAPVRPGLEDVYLYYFKE